MKSNSIIYCILSEISEYVETEVKKNLTFHNYKSNNVQWNHHSKVNKCVNQLNVSCCWFIILWMIYVTVFINITTFNYLGDSIAEAHNFGFKMTIYLYKQTSVLILLLKHISTFKRGMQCRYIVHSICRPLWIMMIRRY